MQSQNHHLNEKKEVLLYEDLKERIFNTCGSAFEVDALRMFRFQYYNNSIYRQYCDALHVFPGKVYSILNIPFLPIELFKTQDVKTENKRLTGSDSRTFLSSGTTGQERSRHVVNDISIYETSFHKCFEFFYGNIETYNFQALVPSYRENEQSSLIYMLNNMIAGTRMNGSGYYTGDPKQLEELIRSTVEKNKKIILFGVSYALLELAKKNSDSFRSLKGQILVMETGGMKGRHKEMIRAELHEILCKGFDVERIHSEYGMTELLSQAYSNGNGIFRCPPWMRVMVRDTEDPLSQVTKGRTGGINVIDLANINSCCFVATQDLGRIHEDESFEVVGRFDNSDIRGCNLLV